jgi:hypothetical protein
MTVSLDELVSGMMDAITRATASGDMMATEVAKHYAANPVLCHVNAPKTRLLSVQLDLKVALTEPTTSAAKVGAKAALLQLPGQLLSTPAVTSMVKPSHVLSSLTSDGAHLLAGQLDLALGSLISPPLGAFASDLTDMIVDHVASLAAGAVAKTPKALGNLFGLLQPPPVDVGKLRTRLTPVVSSAVDNILTSHFGPGASNPDAFQQGSSPQLVVTASSLAALPASAIGSVTLQFEMTRQGTVELAPTADVRHFPPAATQKGAA